MPELAHIPYELLHEPLMTAHQANLSTAAIAPAWDPYEGNRIATTSAQNIYFANQAAVGLVAFPTGQLGEELSASWRAPESAFARDADRPEPSFLSQTFRP
jgi:hypothetical protein